MTSHYDGKVALISGGASGIGRALGRLLAKRGAVVVLADRQHERAQEVAEQIRSQGGRASGVELDVRDADAYEEVAAAAVASGGPIDLFFNNAGIGVGGPMCGYSKADWDDVLDVNVRGVAYGIQAVYKRMVEQGHGHIVNVASMAGLVPATNEGSYGMSKHAVVGVSRALRLEGEPRGVKVSALCPGAIRTPILTGGKFGRIKLPLSEDKILEMWERLKPMDVDEFAVEVLKDVEANVEVIVIPRIWRGLWLADRMAPTLMAHVWRWLSRKAQEDIDAAVEDEAASKRGNGAAAEDRVRA